MIVRFWGIRSKAARIETPWDTQERIAAVVQRMKAEDVKDTVSRNRFLSALPEYIYSRFGGNTPCTEIRSEENGLILFNCGSGLHSFCNNQKRSGEKIMDYNIFLTQLSHDHLSGLASFLPLWNSMARITFYSPFDNMEEVIEQYISPPSITSDTESLAASLYYTKVNSSAVEINGFRITSSLTGLKDTAVYTVVENNKKLLFAPDLTGNEDFLSSLDNKEMFFKSCSSAILGNYFSLGSDGCELEKKMGTPYSLSISFAQKLGVKHLLMTHLPTDLSDKDLFNLSESAQWFERQTRRTKAKALHVEYAREGINIEL